MGRSSQRTYNDSLLRFAKRDRSVISFDTAVWRVQKKIMANDIDKAVGSYFLAVLDDVKSVHDKYANNNELCSFQDMLESKFAQIRRDGMYNEYGDIHERNSKEVMEYARTMSYRTDDRLYTLKDVCGVDIADKIYNWTWKNIKLLLDGNR